VERLAQTGARNATLADVVDPNNNGIRDPNEPGIAGVAVQLTGTDDRGDPVNVSLNASTVVCAVRAVA
jgi:hypothetical protein